MIILHENVITVPTRMYHSRRKAYNTTQWGNVYTYFTYVKYNTIEYVNNWYNMSQQIY